jgi:hypothetical protein
MFLKGFGQPMGYSSCPGLTRPSTFRVLKDVDARDKPGHDERKTLASPYPLTSSFSETFSVLPGLAPATRT